MDVREKLVDDVHGKLMGLLQRAPYIRCEDVNRQYAVNWLMNNGVTVQEWIPVTEQLPKTGERVLVCIGAVFEAFIDDAGKWQRYYSAPLNEVLGEPTHWMPLPEPPKEVE